MQQINTKRLVETALLFAIAMILSFVKLFEMPWGGSVTLCASLPIILIAYRYGTKWGFFSAFVFSVLQLLTDMSALRGISGIALVLSILLDYILAYTVLGIGGLFRNRIKQPAVALALGSVVALVGRFLCSFASGFLIWGEYAQDTLTSLNTALANSVLESFSGFGLAVVYSLVYNGMYMLPEIAITAVVALLIGNISKIREKL